jgi:tetratricopeptide (TPR) repeat protein
VAKKKLNKKIAIIGSLVVVLLLGACAVALLAVTGSPGKYLAMGDDVMAKKEYQDAKRYYGKAYGVAKDQEKKNEVLVKLAEVYKNTDEWDKAVGCWSKIAVADKSNVPARENLLSYYFDYCDSAGFTGNVWNNVVSAAGELIALKPSGELYLKKGRGELEIGKAGGIVDQDKKVDEAIADLKKATELSPKLAEAYEYLFQAYILKSEMSRQKGVSREQVDSALAEAAKVAEEATKAAPEDPTGPICAILLKLSSTEDAKQSEAMAPDVQSIVTRYPKSRDAYSLLIRYYSSRPSLYVNNIDKVVDTAKKVYDLEPTAANALVLCDSYYRRAYLHKDVKDIDAAIDIAKKGLELPDSKDSSGPRAEGNKRARRLPLNSYLAICYIDKALQWDGGGNKDYVKEAEVAINNMEQIFGSGDNHYVMMWHGILAYAMGQKTEGEKRMYAAYSQFKATDEWNIQSAQVAYWLAGAFANSDETGALFEFLTNAIKGNRGNKGTIKPELILDFADTAMKMRLGEYAVTILDQYEGTYGQNGRSQELRVQADLASGKLEDAAKILDKMPADSAAALKSRIQLFDAEAKAAGLADIADANNTARIAKQEADLAKYVEKRVSLLDKLLEVAPKEVDAGQLLGIVNYLVLKGKTETARKMTDIAAAARPDDTALQLLKMRLSEPDPGNISPDRGKEMTMKVLSDIKDPYAKAMALGGYYASGKDTAAAAAQYAKALELKPNDAVTVSIVFDLAVQMGDAARIAQMTELAKKANLDGCQGQLYEARKAMQEKNYEAALALLDKCIAQMPVSSLAYLFRSDVRAKLGMENESIADAEMAAQLNPLGMQVTRQLAILLGKRNEKLGDRATPDQIQHARDALVRAVAANPNDSALLNLYVQGLVLDKPEIAFANMQRIYKVSPTSDNAARLADMALQLASKEQDITRKDGMMQIAGSTLEAAYKADPNNPAIVRAYADYYRIDGKPQKADELIQSSKNADIEWRYYLNAGQADQAKAILVKLYAANPKDIDVLKGLSIVSDLTQDKTGALEYGRKLVELEDTATTRLNLIQTYVKYSMYPEAYKDLDSFAAKYPDDWRGDLLKALMMMNEGKYVEAREVTNKVLQKNQTDAGAWRLRGELDARLGDIIQAVASLQKSKLIADSPAIRMSLARAFMADGRENEAIEELRGAVALEKGPQEAALMLERIYANSGRVNELRGMYEAILKLYPNNYIWLAKTASMYSQLGEQEKAIEMFRQAWRSSEAAGSPSPMALNGWLMGLIQSGQYADVVALAAKYVDSTDTISAVAYTNMADASYKKGDKAAAMRYYENALQKSVQDSSRAFSVIDRMYNAIGEQESVAWCNQKLQKDAKDIIANIAMYNMLLRSGKTEDARKYGATIVSIVGPKTEGGLAYRINDTDLLLRSYLVSHDKKVANDAIKELEGLAADLDTNPGALGKVLNNLAFLLGDVGNRDDEAVEAVKKAYNISPFDGNVLDTYAFVLYKKGLFKDAKEKARSSIQFYEKTGEAVPFEVYERLGTICEKLDEKPEAATAFKKAIELGGKGLPKEKLAELTEAVKRVEVPAAN